MPGDVRKIDEDSRKKTAIPWGVREGRAQGPWGVMGLRMIPTSRPVGQWPKREVRRGVSPCAATLGAARAPLLRGGEIAPLLPLLRRRGPADAAPPGRYRLDAPNAAQTSDFGGALEEGPGLQLGARAAQV